MKQVYLHRILAFSLLSCLFFSACEKEQAGGDDFFEEEPPPIENTTDDIDELIIPQQTSITFPYQVKKEVGKKIIALYPVEGEGEVTLRHSIYPFYAFEKNNSNGDYYLIKSEVAVTNDKMYQGYMKQLFQDDAKGLRTTTHICGFYLREIRIRYELVDKEGNTVGVFPTGHSPTPTTTVGSTTYTAGFSWSLGAQIRIGSDTLKAIPLIWNIAYNNEAKRNIQDMDVRNSSTGQTAQYAFTLNNLPSSNSEDGFIPKLPPPALSISTNTYAQEFIWREPETKDGQGDHIAFTLNQYVEVDYGICYSLTSSLGLGPRYELEEYIETVKCSSSVKLNPPCRIPMGMLKITNKNKGQYIKDIAISKKGEEPKVLSKGSLAYGKSFKTYINVGEYNVEFKMGSTSKNVKTYTLDHDCAKIVQDETLELFSDYDFIRKN